MVAVAKRFLMAGAVLALTLGGASLSTAEAHGIGVTSQQVAYDPAHPQVAYDPAHPQVAYDPAHPQVAYDPAHPQVAYDPAYQERI